MSSSKQKDQICSCEHKLFVKNLKDVDILENLSKEYRYEVWDDIKFLCFLEYIEDEKRWFYFLKAVEFDYDENKNISIHTIEFFEGDNDGK